MFADPRRLLLADALGASATCLATALLLAPGHVPTGRFRPGFCSSWPQWRACSCAPHGRGVRLIVATALQAASQGSFQFHVVPQII